MAETGPVDPHLRALDPDAALAGLADALRALDGVAVRVQEPFAAHLPMRSGGPAELWVEVDDLDAMRQALRTTRAHHYAWSLCWPFEDRLVRDGGLAGVVVRPGLGFETCTLLPAEPGLPLRLLMGAATPWAAAARFADQQGPPAVLASWPGCPGGSYTRLDPTALEGLLCGLTYARGRKVERLDIAYGATPPPLTGTAVLLSVEVPLAFPAGTRAQHDRPVPPPLGTLFEPPDAFDLTRQLRAAGVVGSRLRAWRMAWSEPGTLVNLGGGDTRSALLLAKGIAEHVKKSRGVEPKLRLPVDGVDGPRSR